MPGLVSVPYEGSRKRVKTTSAVIACNGKVQRNRQLLVKHFDTIKPLLVTIECYKKQRAIMIAHVSVYPYDPTARMLQNKAGEIMMPQGLAPKKPIALKRQLGRD